MLLRDKYLKILCGMLPAGAVGVSLITRERCAGCRRSRPAAEPAAGRRAERVSDRLAAIRMPYPRLTIRKPRKPESRWLGGGGETAAAAGAMVVQPGAMAAGVTGAAKRQLAQWPVEQFLAKVLGSYSVVGAHISQAPDREMMWAEMSCSRQLIKGSDRCHCRANM